METFKEWLEFEIEQATRNLRGCWHQNEADYYSERISVLEEVLEEYISRG